MRIIYTTAYIALAAVLSLLTGCSVTDEGGSVLPARASLEVSVDGGAQVRSVSSAGEGDVNSWSVLVCTPSGKVVASRSGVSSSTVFDLECASYVVHAVANCPFDVSSMTDVSQLVGRRVSLGDNSLSGGLVMYGKGSVDVVPQGASVTVPLQRLVSKVVIDRIRVDFQAKPVLSGKTMTLDAVYLINVAGDAVVGSAQSPSDWINRMAWTGGSSADALVRDDIGVVLGPSSPYNRSHYLYAFENVTVNDSEADVWSARHTRLVVQCSIEGEKYYYSVPLPGMARNTQYRITDLLIKDWGSRSPQKRQEAAIDVVFSESLAWDDTYNVEEQS